MASKNAELLTAPKKNAGRSISFLPTSCRFAKVCYFYVGKKGGNIEQLINIVEVANIVFHNRTSFSSKTLGVSHQDIRHDKDIHYNNLHFGSLLLFNRQTTRQSCYLI